PSSTAPAALGRTGIGLGWWERGRAGFVRKAVLPDQGAQSPLLGIFAPWPPADFVYSCSVSLLICSIWLLSRYGFAGLRLHALLVIGIAMPVQQLLLFEKASPTQKMLV
ncbi:MAG: hypothetical protein ACKOPS_14225, partial [Cyanobium sp.]